MLRRVEELGFDGMKKTLLFVVVSWMYVFFCVWLGWEGSK